MSAIRDQITELANQARALAMATCLQPKTEREYLLACGKVQQLMADARALKERFIDPEVRASDREAEIPDDLDTDDNPPAPRRVVPQNDRLARSRAGHRPRSI